MKISFVALSAVALLVGAHTTRAMLPGVSEIGRHIPTVPAAGTQDQFKGDIYTPGNGPMLAPGMLWRLKNGIMLAPGMPTRPPKNGIMLAPGMPTRPPKNGIMLAPGMPTRPPKNGIIC